MKTLHLHIGSAKTGTTSIQKTFHNNRNELAQQGFLYPGNTFNHHNLFFATRSEKKDWPRYFKRYDRQTLRIAIDNYFDILEKWLAADFDNQIISTEYLFIDNIQSIRNLLEYLEPFFSEIKVYLFVRNPIEYYRSRQQQKIKACSYITPPNEFHYNFKKVIKAWSGFCHVEVIEYKKEENSCEILCEKMGLNFRHLSGCGRENNSSLSLEQMLLLEKIQRNLYRDFDDRFKNHLGIVHKMPPNSSTKPKLKEGVKVLLEQNHKKDAEWLQKKYNIDFLSTDLNAEELSSKTPVFENGRAAITDVYKIDDPDLFERYESSVIDLLLKKVMQQHLK